MPNRKCVVCGARVRQHNQKVDTCDGVCHRAKKAGRTRPGQIAFEMAQPEEPHAVATCFYCGRDQEFCECAENWEN